MESNTETQVKDVKPVKYRFVSGIPIVVEDVELD
jgi:hypothetical protein